MLIAHTRKTHMILKYGKLFAIAPALMLLTGCSGSGINWSAPNLMQMFESLRSTLPSLWMMIIVTCMVTGVYLMYKGLADLVIVAKMSGSMMGGQQTSGPPILMIMLSTVFFYLPIFISSMSVTVFGQGSESLLSYQPISSGNGLPLGMSVCVDVIRFISMVAFVRGVFLLTRHAHRNGQTQPGNFQKAFTHIIGGVLGVNILTTWGALMATLGMGQ